MLAGLVARRNEADGGEIVGERGYGVEDVDYGCAAADANVFCAGEGEVVSYGTMGGVAFGGFGVHGEDAGFGDVSARMGGGEMGRRSTEVRGGGCKASEEGEVPLLELALWEVSSSLRTKV
jgi:hypothetical protein